MRIGILGTGAVAEALGAGWARAGHEVAVGGRSPDRARALAGRLGGTARAAGLREAAEHGDAVLLAVRSEGVADVLRAVGDALRGTVLIDPTNDVEHGVGVLRGGEPAARRIAALAPGAHVVKAFHLFPAEQWAKPGGEPVTVAMCGDDPEALRITAALVRDAGGVPAVLGSLDRAGQLEEVAGFAIALAFTGFDPRSAMPQIPANHSLT